ncbi:hypothetical protein CK203_018147 [Vitis vinifera]|uniref:Uncharacterized protein n=1 Tax=Vitis vinifera TaxID=29760 RepID=A0A438JPC9_VITVI|nr:hypothetical protein CK203_018147 [Vitis vinifera]
MSAKKDAASSSTVGQSGKDASGEVHAEKSVDKLNMREFCARFCIPNGVSVQLVDGEAVSTEKSADNAIYFTKEQFNVGLRFPLPSLFKEFLHFTQIPPAYIHPNMVRVLMGCSILNMLFNLDLSLLEVLFIYSIKKGKNDIYSFVARLPFLQLVTSLPDSTKGVARGHVLVKGVWAGLTEHPDRQFAPNQSLKVPGMNKLLPVLLRLRVKLLEIAEDERSYETLLSAQNLRMVTQEPQLRPSTQSASQRTEERRQEGTLRKAPGDKRSASSPPTGAPAGKKKKVPTKGKTIKPPTPTKGVIIKSPAPTKGIVIRSPAPSNSPSTSSGSGHIACLNGSGPTMPTAE